MRRCSSRGSRENSCTANVFQLIVGDNEPTEIAIARSKKRSLCRNNGRNSGRQTSGFPAQYHRMGGTDALNFRHSELALVPRSSRPKMTSPG